MELYLTSAGTVERNVRRSVSPVKLLYINTDYNYIIIID